MNYRPVLTTYRSNSPNWVGDGFLTIGMLPYATHVSETNPFLLSGYNAPRFFPPAERPRGVGEHPHCGFETVTIVFQGGLAHADSAGKTGTIGPGDVQWMTAGRGIRHAEFHSDAINREGGTLEMVQLWVNLPQAYRNVAPRYQDIRDGDIPVVTLPGGGRLRVIAGSYGGVTGPAQTYSPLGLWDAYLPEQGRHEFDLPEGWTVSVQLLSGRLRIDDERVIEGPETVIFSTEPGEVELEAQTEAHYLVLAAEQLREPLAMGGAFVAGSEAGMEQAYSDFRRGLY